MASVASEEYGPSQEEKAPSGLPILDVIPGVAGLGGRPEGDAADCVLGISAKNQAFEIIPGVIVAT